VSENDAGETEATEAGTAVGRRARHRMARTEEFLRTALDIVTTEGFDALTMQRLADQCEAAVGAVYRYFPSKGALVAELQREAVERLATSYALLRARTDPELSSLDLTAPELALARVVLMGRWFLALGDSHPQELRLLQMLMAESRVVVPIEEGIRVIPSIMRLLDQARLLLDDGVAAGCFDDREDAMTRIVVWTAGVGGVLQAGRLDVYEADLFVGRDLARMLTMDLFHAWGAGLDELAAANGLVDRLAASGPLAPR
jgi:AcrR family transcriptional regulator